VIAEISEAGCIGIADLDWEIAIVNSRAARLLDVVVTSRKIHITR